MVAAAQAVLLLAVGVYVLIEAIRRLFEPAEIASAGMLVFGIVGMVGNAVSVTLLAASHAGGSRSGQREAAHLGGPARA